MPPKLIIRGFLSTNLFLYSILLLLQVEENLLKRSSDSNDNLVLDAPADRNLDPSLIFGKVMYSLILSCDQQQGNIFLDPFLRLISR